MTEFETNLLRVLDSIALQIEKQNTILAVEFQEINNHLDDIDDRLIKSNEELYNIARTL